MRGAALDAQTLQRLEVTRGPILIALSGGGDSTALLHLLCDTLGPARLRVGVVDHALRDTSAADAARAESVATALGVGAEVLTLAWPDGAARSQDAARGLRYRALCAAARGLGAVVIATAHTADDQAETVLMRAASGSSWRGLAAMAAWAPAPVWPQGRGIAIARPLLGARRAALRALLEARGAPWIDDPANANAAFARVRARARLADLELAGFDPMRLADLAAGLGPLAETVRAEAAVLVERAAKAEGGAIAVERETWGGSAEARRRALAALVAAAAGAEREPEAAALSRLEARWMTDGFRGASLGGARLARRRNAVVLSRDPGALGGRAGGGAPMAPLDLPAGVATVWDGRLEMTAAAPGWRVLAAGAAGPELVRGGETLPLQQAADVVNARWLLGEHLVHRLGASFS